MTQAFIRDHMFRRVFDGVPDPCWIIDPYTSKFLYVNSESEKQLGFSIEELLEFHIGVIDVNLMLPTHEEWIKATAGMELGQIYRVMAHLRRKNSEVFKAEMAWSRLKINQRSILVAVAHQLAKDTAVEVEMKERDHLLQTVFDTMTEAVIYVDANDRCAMSNYKVPDLLGGEFIGCDRSDLIALFEHLDVCGVTSPTIDSSLTLCQALQEHQSVHDLLIEGHFPNNQTLWMIANLTPLREHEKSGAVLTLTDVSEVKRTQALAHHMTTTDILTDLPNRKNFISAIDSWFGHGRMHDVPVALILIDVDRFRLINDTQGHLVGDELLIQVADRLRLIRPSHGFLARVSADEFGYVFNVNACALKEAQFKAELFAAQLANTLGETYFLSCGPIQASVSVGLLLTQGAGITAESALRYCSVAQEAARTAGGDCWRVFNPQMLNLPTSRFLAESALYEALQAKEFLLHFQPKVNLKSGQMMGVEALIRWNRTGHNIVEPAEFIDLAERSNLITLVGDWVIGEACRTLQEIKAMGLEEVLGVMSINVSPRQFRQSDFVSRLKAMVEDFGVTPSSLCIELTETALANDTDQVVASLQELSEFGFALSIDDFGAGYSSFSYLQSFKIHELKIDRSFIKDVDTSEQGMMIVRAMLAMAKAMSLTVVAEGIERQAQQKFLTDDGCDIGQGYLFARPMPLLTLVDWMRSHENVLMH